MAARSQRDADGAQKDYEYENYPCHVHHSILGSVPTSLCDLPHIGAPWACLNDALQK